jgi:HEAT repeat protein
MDDRKNLALLLVALALVLGTGVQCRSARSEGRFSGPVHEIDDLDTDDVGAVRKKYHDVTQTTADVISRLAKGLREDPRSRVRANAATALDELPIMDAFGKSVFAENRRDIRRYLLAALDDPDLMVVARAANALSLHDLNEENVRTTLQQHLGRIRAACAAPSERVADDALWTLRHMDEPLPLDLLLRSSNARFRDMGIEQAGISPDAAMVPPLIAIAERDPEPALRRRAIPVIAEQAPPAVRDALLQRLVEDPDEKVASEAIRAVIKMGMVSLIPQLRQLLGRSSGARLQATIRALGKLGDKASIADIAAHLGADPDARAECVLALDALVGPQRSLSEWQAWARQQGYLR